MSYERNDAGNPGYHASDDTPMFFEEDESKYASSNYDSKDPFSAGYNSQEEEKDNIEMTEFEQQLEEQDTKKYDKNEEESAFIQKKAAQEVMLSGDDKEVKKKGSKSIEDAIESAVKEEKEVVVLDR